MSSPKPSSPSSPPSGAAAREDAAFARIRGNACGNLLRSKTLLALEVLGSWEVDLGVVEALMLLLGGAARMGGCSWKARQPAIRSACVATLQALLATLAP